MSNNSKRVTALLILPFLAFSAGCGREKPISERNDIVYVYAPGDYIDPEVVQDFEEETGIEVVLDTFETNESMYPKIAEEAAVYDVICPSDYMIDKMIQNDMLQPLNYAMLPNVRKYIGKRFLEQSEEFDPGNRYSVPYFWGTVGIAYNKKMVFEKPDSWAVLWDPQYRNNILMQDSVRDAFAVALKLNGDSLNTTDGKELADARDLLMEQKELVQAYGVDELKDKMVSGEAALSVIYSGDALMMTLENPDLDYVIPKEGTNLWIDSWVIPKNAPHVQTAHAFINYLSGLEASLKNFEYIGYSSPNTEVREAETDEAYRDSVIAFPDLDNYTGLETYRYLGEDMDYYYNDLWIQVKSY